MPSASETWELRLEFETADFLQSLFGHDEQALRYLEEVLPLRVVTRDGWVLFQGAEADCRLAGDVVEDMEKLRREGGVISPRDFRLAVDLALENSRGKASPKVSDLQKIKLEGGRGRGAVTARSPRQHAYLVEMLEKEVVFGLGPAGTGKTYLAMAMALDLLKKKAIRRVILTRPAVEAGEALGFLPGDLQEKVAPYLRPLYDAIDDILGREDGQKYLEDGTIEIAPLAYMRGRTLSHAFVILDEAQNTTREQMFMALTRLGEGSRMVVTGDASQVDLKKGESSGLAEAEAALGGVKGIGFVTFEEEDVVRHPVVARIIAAYGEHRE
ncbi:MAG: PhoH family protein [Verrucomicrobiales bacterium]